jgi:hypothetical protein
VNWNPTENYLSFILHGALVGAGSLWPNFRIIEVNFSKAKSNAILFAVYFSSIFFVTLEISFQLAPCFSPCLILTLTIDRDFHISLKFP